jgi:hypothetical protein
LQAGDIIYRTSDLVDAEDTSGGAGMELPDLVDDPDTDEEAIHDHAD